MGVDLFMGEKEDMFNIRNGNVCSLCEKELSWLAPIQPENGVIIQLNKPIALDGKRAICNVCYGKLKERYE